MQGAVAVALLAVFVGLGFTTVRANHLGWKMPLDGFCEQEPEAAGTTARWIDGQTGGEGFVVASHSSGWLLETSSAHILHVTARRGVPTTWFPEPLDDDRFAVDCRLEKARFVWVEQTLRYWAAYQPGVASVLFDAELEGWPLVFRRGIHEVYANPRTWKGPVVEKEPAMVGVAELYHRLGDDFLDRGDAAKALAAYERLAQLEPGNTAARHRAALAAVGLGDWERARGFWQQVLHLDPEFLAARQGLAELDSKTTESVGEVTAEGSAAGEALSNFHSGS